MVHATVIYLTAIPRARVEEKKFSNTLNADNTLEADQFFFQHVHYLSSRSCSIGSQCLDT